MIGSEFTFVIYFYYLTCIVILMYVLIKLVAIPKPILNNVKQLKYYVKKHKKIGHRGYTNNVAENTLKAVDYVASLQDKAIEVDVHCTKDKTLILMHDDTVDRTTDGHGFVVNLTTKKIEQLNACSKFNHSNCSFNCNCKVPTLEQVIKKCIKNEIYIFFDIRITNEYVIRDLLYYYKKYPYLYSHSVLCAFDWIFIRKMRSLDNEIVAGLTYEYMFKHYKTNIFNFLIFAIIEFFHKISLYVMSAVIGNSFLLLENKYINMPIILISNYFDLDVIFWTVNDMATKKKIKEYGAAYMTDVHDKL
ncbi:putative glycerophosphoryl diester phosphodiesterase YhdW [Intoshia linei]|uniref:Putative glycerophosphoryl diester phosphodiesterase YhdW n=1 Tax=Intoshia linei TaxID=1819745 RepID=A0A177BD23_9BILA|nr:putative glycerophosphoryl diester phosphodiesterase YhdW [Intoshia linei]